MSRTTRKNLLIAGVIAGIAILFCVEEKIRGLLLLRQCERAALAGGEALTIATVAGQMTNTPGVRILLPALVQSVFPVPSLLDIPAAGKMVATGKARAASLEPDFESGLKKNAGQTNAWSEFARRFQGVREQLPAIRQSLTNHAFVVAVDYESGWDTLLPHLGPMKAIAQTLSADTLLALHERRFDEALADLTALAALSDTMESERTIISQLVRAAIAAIGINAVWEALQHDGWTDAQLAALQQAWDRAPLLHGLIRALEMERAIARRAYASRATGAREIWDSQQNRSTQSDDLGGVPTFVSEAGARFRTVVHFHFWRLVWIEQDRAAYLEQMGKLLSALRNAAGGSDWRKENLCWPSSGGATPTWRHFDESCQHRLRHKLPLWASQALLQSAVLPLSIAARTEARKALALAAIAIKRYELRHGRLPSNLDALVPEFLPRPPRDPMDGQQLRYRPTADGRYLLYSVGFDGVDQGGDLATAPGIGNDVVWPMRATPSEIEGEAPRYPLLRTRQ